jgi:hypothetical protein
MYILITPFRSCFRNLDYLYTRKLLFENDGKMLKWFLKEQIFVEKYNKAVNKN